MALTSCVVLSIRARYFLAHTCRRCDMREMSGAAKQTAAAAVLDPCVHRIAYYICDVVQPWRNAASRKVWQGERPNQFRGLDFEAAVDLLLALNVAKTLQDLSPLKSVGLHKLKGGRKGQWAMTVNQRWRICFEFRKGDAYEVEILDYHKG